MDHCLPQDVLFAYWDDELATDRRAFVAKHVDACAECRRSLDAWAAASRNVLAPLRVRASESFVQNVMRSVRLYDEQNERLDWRRFVRWAIPALALSAASFAGTLIYTLQPPVVTPDNVISDDQDAVTLTSWLSRSDDEPVLASLVMPR